MCPQTPRPADYTQGRVEFLVDRLAERHAGRTHGHIACRPVVRSVTRAEEGLSTAHFVLSAQRKVGGRDTKQSVRSTVRDVRSRTRCAIAHLEKRTVTKLPRRP